MHMVPNIAAASYRPTKNEKSTSLSQVQYPNHFSATTTSADVQEQFEPTFVKLDKQVSLREWGNNLSMFCPPQWPL